MLLGEERAAAAEPGGDLVEDQQHAVPVARLAQRPQVSRVVEAHPAGPLDDRLDDHRRQLGRVLLHRGRQGIGVAVVPPGGRLRDEDLLG